MPEYPNFATLSKQEKPKNFRIRTSVRKDSRVAVIAPHGGAIEPGTSEIAIAIASNDCSFAAFEGRKAKNNRLLHITSTNFDEPLCIQVVSAAQKVVAIHGENSAEDAVFLGGRDKQLGIQIRAALEEYGFKVAIHPSVALQGLDPANVCNRGLEKAGVQLELSQGLRRRFFCEWNAKGRESPTEELTRFVAAVRKGLGLESELKVVAVDSPCPESKTPNPRSSHSAGPSFNCRTRNDDKAAAAVAAAAGCSRPDTVGLP